MSSSEQFSVDVLSTQFVLSIHTENPAHEARIRWEIVNQDLSGEWGRLYLPEDMPRGADQIIQEPILAFGSQKPIIDEDERKSVELPRSIARRLQDILDDFGTATSNADSVCNDPSQFPTNIHYQTQISTRCLNKTSWDADQQIMWYSADTPQAQSGSSRFAELVNKLDVYAYQIENRKLIHRTEEYPSDGAVNELKRLLQQAIPNLDEQSDTGSYRINERLK